MATTEPQRDRPVILFDLRDVKAWVETRTAGEATEYLLVVTDGFTRLEMTGGLGGRSSASVFGAQRVATAALDYASGLAMFNLPDAPDAED
jgi:hypothetical protein